MRHALGVLGVAAASVLLLVSAAMNWRFGYSLGDSELDAQLLGVASAAADAMKALIPFFLFAALRNKQWSQALAASVLWTVCLTYSLTSALGFSALNRAETSGERVVQAAVYGDLRTELEKTRERLSWVPQHRPADSVQADIDGLKQQKRWKATADCTNATTQGSREFCQQYHQFSAELAAAMEAGKLQVRIDEIRVELAKATTTDAVIGADPQAQVLSNLFGQNIEVVKTALTVMVAMLVELGSSLGFYVVFSMWKVHGEQAPRPALPVTTTRAAQPQPVPVPVNTAIANDNRAAVQPKLVAPETDVERFHRDRVTSAEGESLNASALYEDYCTWCEEHRKEPLALPTFGRQFGELGVHKVKIAGRMRYLGVKLKEIQTTTEEPIIDLQQTKATLAA